MTSNYAQGDYPTITPPSHQAQSEPVPQRPEIQAEVPGAEFGRLIGHQDLRTLSPTEPLGQQKPHVGLNYPVVPEICP